MRKLFSAKHELFALLLMCSSASVAGQMLANVPSDDYFALDWSRETFSRIQQRYRDMEVSDGVLKFTSLISDEHISEETQERLESGWKKFKKEEIDPDEVIENLCRWRKLRRCNELSEQINTALHQGDEVLDPDVILTDIKEHLTETEAGTANVKDWFWHMGTEFNMEPVLERIMSDEVKGFVPTGFKPFDEKNGGIEYGSMVVIAGTTGGGKSIAAQHMFQHMSMFEDCCLVPLEMTEDQVVSRMLAREGEVEIHKIAGKTWNADEKERALLGLKKFHKKVKAQGNKATIFRPKTDVSIEEIFTLLHPYNYRVIIIDYISLLKGADGDEAWQKLGQIARAAKVYAANNNKIVVLLAQLNDEGKVRYARSISEHANVAFHFVATEHTKEQGILDVKLPKARNQDPTPFTLEIEYKYMKISGAEANVSTGESDDAKAKASKPGKSKGKDGSDKGQSEPGKGRKYLDKLGDL